MINWQKSDNIGNCWFENFLWLIYFPVVIIRHWQAFKNLDRIYKCWESGRYGCWLHSVWNIMSSPHFFAPHKAFHYDKIVCLLLLSTVEIVGDFHTKTWTGSALSSQAITFLLKFTILQNQIVSRPENDSFVLPPLIRKKLLSDFFDRILNFLFCF